MPIYEYKCNDCGSLNEFMVGVTAEKEELKCKKCNSIGLEKIFSSFSLGKNETKGNPKCSSCLSQGPTCPYRGST